MLFVAVVPVGLKGALSSEVMFRVNQPVGNLKGLTLCHDSTISFQGCGRKQK